MKTKFRVSFKRDIIGLLLLLSCVALDDGRAADAVTRKTEAPTPEAIVSEASLSLAAARKTHSNQRAAGLVYFTNPKSYSRANHGALTRRQATVTG
jgi:hypothetical protein